MLPSHTYSLDGFFAMTRGDWRRVDLYDQGLPANGVDAVSRKLHQRRPTSFHKRYGINTSIEPSADMLTWLVPASTSGVTGAESMAAAFIIMGARR